MAVKSGGRLASSGPLTRVDLALGGQPVLTSVRGTDDNNGDAEFIYLQGCAATVKGSVVTYDHLGQTTLLVADASGPVAVALAAVDAITKYGWYCVKGIVPTLVAANSAVAVAGGKNPGFELVAGQVGDGRAAGDEILNFWQRVATTTAALALCQIDHPSVNNFSGA
jgi:hypothetical protein